ncbi:uncharacterized protein TRIADDRAFT_25833 [Trichoplax adhaerens]|uniref:4-hydroxybenzoate polyprenyltransferase, mitochondrial n=1 Tax=Trichoplax adhaerens TaxID=10228 RepID=B3RWH5_TRIAD|nr:hypothetical protein TRIADDRAFT_25833 [Trichoplax adhaerens]EDV24693.1 hypothetical protein TRIADDRAFT_25833 [Trichoplax adhaerens]|eukprot:XP_002112583.1 hypothetical protein TRIADDRAFT_25833 [Trichoplax adhaerens]
MEQYNKPKSRTFTTKIVQHFPNNFQPYLRLIRFDRPIGTYLLYLPCTWSISMAATPGHLPDLKTLAVFGIGALVMRGAGCTINDMWDSDFDKKVFRTRDRPIASGTIAHKQALGFLAAQLTVGLSILLSLNQYSIILGACSVPFVIVYPLMKRFTFWPQLFLGITFNWGALLGYAAVNGYCDWNVVIPLYAASISWTLFYDTIYAHQDKDDDRFINVKSTALLFGDNTKHWLSLFAGITTTGLVLSGLSAHQTWPYFAAVGGGFAHLLYQIYSVNISNTDSCLKVFKSNMWYGLIIFTGIIGGKLLLREGKEEQQSSQ